MDQKISKKNQKYQIMDQRIKRKIEELGGINEMKKKVSSMPRSTALKFLQQHPGVGDVTAKKIISVLSETSIFSGSGNAFGFEVVMSDVERFVNTHCKKEQFVEWNHIKNCFKSLNQPNNLKRSVTFNETKLKEKKLLTLVKKSIF